MNTRHIFISTLLVLCISCSQEAGRSVNDYSNGAEVRAKELKTDAKSDRPKYQEFARHVLNGRLRKHDFKYVLENCRHHELFPVDGLEKIIAFSDRSYPKKINPTDYEHFILFCFKYATSAQAKANFDNFYLHTQLDPTKYDAVEQSYIGMHQKIKEASKPGGLIVQENEWIFSLVETCRETPIGGNWVDYENLFLSYLANEETDSLIVLNADCGKMNYRKEKRTIHNSQ